MLSSPTLCHIEPKPQVAGPTNPEGVPFHCPPSLHQADFIPQVQEPWQKGNTKRYGCNTQPWSRKAIPTRGVGMGSLRSSLCD